MFCVEIVLTTFFQENNDLQTQKKLKVLMNINDSTKFEFDFLKTFMYLHVITELQKQAKESFFKMPSYHYENLNLTAYEKRKTKKSKVKKN